MTMVFCGNCYWNSGFLCVDRSIIMRALYDASQIYFNKKCDCFCGNMRRNNRFVVCMAAQKTLNFDLFVFFLLYFWNWLHLIFFDGLIWTSIRDHPTKEFCVFVLFFFSLSLVLFWSVRFLSTLWAEPEWVI